MISLAKRLVPNRLKLYRYARLGRYGWYLQNRDRRLLQETILPWFAARRDVRKVLDVGVEWYNRNYYKRFPDADYFTIDICPTRERHGREGRHHTICLTRIHEIFEEGQFDVVLSNGPWGWGLDSREGVIAGMEQVAHVVRPGGFVLIGRNDREGYRTGIPTREAASMAGIVPFTFPPLGLNEVLANEKTAHIYEFYRKPAC